MSQNILGNKTLRVDDLPCDAKIENDMIECVKLERTHGFSLCLNVKFASGRQSLFRCYNNTSNIGHVILTLCELLGVGDEDDCDDVLDALSGSPCRVASNACIGDSISEHSWIGHFMHDHWLQAKKIVMSGCKQK